MRLFAFLPVLLASLPLAAGASASASVSVSIRIVSKEWLASNNVGLLAPQRTITAVSKGLLQENGSTYLLADLKGNTFKFEVPEGTEAPAGLVQIHYVPLHDQGRQRLVAMALNDRDLNRLR